VRRGRAARWVLHGVLAAGVALTLLPLWWMLVASLSATGAVDAEPLRLVPRALTAEHYETLFTRLRLARAFANSALIAGSATVLSLLVNSMAGYAFAKLRFAGRDGVFRLLVAALVIPSQVAVLPLFLLIKQMHLVNTYGGVLVPAMASIFGIYLMRQYAQSIPDSLLDAARVDGASELRIYVSVVLPLCRPILVTLAIFTFLGTWNDFLWPLIVLSDQDVHTLPVALANLFGEHVQDTELVMAGSVITVLPVVVAFLCLQRQYLEGLTLGGVKG
jgi:multiple sugar transport system permease protein